MILTNHDDVQAAAIALAGGSVIAQGFANFYVLTTRPDRETVRRVNVMKGRPPEQVGSLTASAERIPTVFDWNRLPAELTPSRVRELMDTLFELGPFGFRGPAARHVPDHLAQTDGPVRTTQVIAPGYACPSNEFLSRSCEMIGGDMLYITSANRSRHLTGAEDEPAHWTAEGLMGEFGREPGFVVIAHADEEKARAAYPRYAPMSVTILAFHKTAGVDDRGRLRLVVERHGSLEVDTLAEILAGLGFAVTLGASARHRLLQREYATQGSLL